ncbi:MAG TPA: hypothetical protein VLT33_05690 [Labilithrix sp.]|nr:hypothetical protein [Labilithrix sp.]
MANGRLLPCPSCARHVRASEEACPFCAAALTPAREGAPLARTPARRLSRAALFALGAGAAAVGACGGESVGSPVDAGRDAPIATPVYGGPPVDAGEDAPFLVDAAYGGPPQDAATDADDASDADSGAAPAYGAPPPGG